MLVDAREQHFMKCLEGFHGGSLKFSRLDPAFWSMRNMRQKSELERDSTSLGPEEADIPFRGCQEAPCSLAGPDPGHGVLGSPP